MSSQPTQTEQMIRCCPRCGADLPPDVTTCPTCGAEYATALAPISAPAPSADQTLDSYVFAMQRFQAGDPPSTVEYQLIQHGAGPNAARTLVQTLLATRPKADRAAAKNAIIDGAVWGIGGIVITLITLLIVQERGGRYLIAWGPAVFGLIQMVRGFIQYRRARPQTLSTGTLPAADPDLVARGFVWPLPKVNNRARFASIALLAVAGVIIAVSSLGQPLIDKPAAQLNLSVADLDNTFSISQETGPNQADVQAVRDANKRILESDRVVIQSMVLIGRANSSDQPTEMIAAVEQSLTNEASSELVFSPVTTLAIGDRAALRPFEISQSSTQAHGYILAFVRRNVLVVIIEIGQAEQVSEDSVQKHARVIDDRMR